MSNSSDRETAWLTLLVNVVFSWLLYLALEAVNDHHPFIDSMVLRCVFIGIITALPFISIICWAAQWANNKIGYKHKWIVYYLFTLSSVYFIVGLINLSVKYTRVEYLQMGYVVFLAVPLIVTSITKWLRRKK